MSELAVLGIAGSAGSAGSAGIAALGALGALDPGAILFIVFLLFPLLGRLLEGLVRLFTKAAEQSDEARQRRQSVDDAPDAGELFRRLLAGEEPTVPPLRRVEEEPEPPPPRPLPTSPARRRRAERRRSVARELQELPAAPSGGEPGAFSGIDLERELAPELGPALDLAPGPELEVELEQIADLGETSAPPVAAGRPRARLALPREPHEWARAFVLGEILAPPLSLRTTDALRGGEDSL